MIAAFIGLAAVGLVLLVVLLSVENDDADAQEMRRRKDFANAINRSSGNRL